MFLTKMSLRNGGSYLRTVIAHECLYMKESRVYKLVAALHDAILFITIYMVQMC